MNKIKLSIALALIAALFLLLLPGMLGRLLGLAISLLLWGTGGYLAGKLLHGRGYGLIGNIALGLAGGFLGSMLLSVLGLVGIFQLPFIGGVVVSTLGAVLLVLVAGALHDGEGE